LIFPLSILVKTMPKPIESHTTVARTTPQARGEYLVRTVAGCQDCHTPAKQGIPIAGLDLAGGMKFNDHGKNMAPVHSRNITPDVSGIAHYDEGLFMQTLRTGQIPGRTLTPWSATP